MSQASRFPTLAEVTAASKQLQAGCERITSELQALEHCLADTDVSVSVRVPIEDQVPEAWLAWKGSAAAKARLVVATATSEVPIANASRRLRVAAARTVGALLTALHDELRSEVDRLNEAIAATQPIVDAFEAVLGKGDPPCR